jgi:hypothetical protein
MNFKIALGSVLLGSSLAAAQDAGTPQPPPPPADEIKRVLDYYYNGKDRGPALVELKACLKVDSAKGSPTSNECLEEVKGPVKRDTTIHGWSLWYLPEGANYDNVSLQFVFGDEVRSTIDLKLNSVGRTRTWRSTTVSKKGKWTIKVKDGAKELGSTSFTVE